MTRLSVALCTYDGERFLGEQLGSIASQTRPPDELVACDDGSLDGTVAVLEEFAAGAPFDVRVERNDRRLGPARNFEKAALLCSGDIVAFSDQDDVWMPGKLAALAGVIEGDGGAAAVFTDAEVVGAGLEPMGLGMWESIGFDESARERFAGGGAVPVLLRTNVVTGATMAVRRSFLERALPLPEGWMHDAWLALAAAWVGGIRLVEGRLVAYRQHPAAQIGSGRRGVRRRAGLAAARSREHYLEEERRFALARERLRLLSGGASPPDLESMIGEKIGHMGRRGGMPAFHPLRLPAILRELAGGGYHRYSNGCRSAIKDLFM